MSESTALPDRSEHPCVARVLAVLARHGVTPEVRHLPDAVRTAAAAAEALGITPAEIANSLVFAAVPTGPTGPTGPTVATGPTAPGASAPLTAGPEAAPDDEGRPFPVLVLSSGGHKVDLTRIAEAAGLPPLRRATPEEVRAWTGFAIGGVAPVGHLTPPRTIVDVSLARFEHVWAAAGHSHSVFETSYADLLALTGGEPLEVAEVPR